MPNPGGRFVMRDGKRVPASETQQPANGVAKAKPEKQLKEKRNG